MKRPLWKSIIGILSLLLLGGIASGTSAAPLAVPPYPTYVAVQMFELTQNGTALPDKPCYTGDTNYGCTIYCDNPEWEVCDQTWPGTGYPYAGSTIYPPIETYYLLDVVSQEMDPRQYSQPVALHAQAIAARSYVGWYLNNAPGGYDNSNARQVFIPYKFDSLNPSVWPSEPNASDPCEADNLNTQQQLVCNAIASGYYLARADSNPGGLPAFAEFTADAEAATHDHPELWRFPYLAGVDDPISAACDAGDNGANLAGMSQEGANRWARGNQCAQPASGDMPWSVIWSRPEQLLFHYYTGVHLRDADGDRLSPDYRWNPLSLSMSGVCPPYMEHGQSCIFTFMLQNTGVWNWTCNPEQDFSLAARWEQNGAPGSKSSAYRVSSASVCDLAKGESGVYDLTLLPLPGSAPGAYTLHFDIYWTDGPDTYYFSDFGWPSYDITACVDGPCRTYLSLVMGSSGGRSSPPDPTASPTPVLP